MNSLNLTRVTKLLETAPPFRLRQFFHDFCGRGLRSWKDVTAWPGTLRDNFEKTLAVSTILNSQLFSSAQKTVFKAALELIDGVNIETVLLPNPKKQWTVCVSTQAGCALKCVFCATGALGLVRNLDPLEVAEQVVFWKKFLEKSDFEYTRISNVVLMGMGEPLLNLEAVKTAIHLWTEYGEIGPNQITLSTVGLFPAMEAILTDPSWIPVKIAISLHSADDKVRKQLMPAHQESYFEKLKAWCHRYETTLGGRTRPLTFEYVMLSGVNDSSGDAKKLVQFLRGLQRIKVNLIPWNASPDFPWKSSPEAVMLDFQKQLNASGITVTLRKSLGHDIAAACGQLVMRRGLVKEGQSL